MSRLIRPAVAGLIFAISLFAAKPDFSGEWKMNVAKSDFGRMTAPQTLTRTIKHTDPSLEYHSVQKGAQGEVATDIKYTTDGQPCTNREAKGTARWVGDNLLIEYTRDFRGVQISSKEIWSLSDGGKTLTISSHVSVPQQGEYDVKLVLDKQ